MPRASRTNLKDIKGNGDVQIEEFSWDDAAQEPSSQARKPRRKQTEQKFEPIRNAQEAMLKELTQARLLLSQQEQVLSRAEKACVESLSTMETAMQKLRLERAREDGRVPEGPGPRWSAAVPLPATEPVVEPQHLAPRIDLPSTPVVSYDNEETFLPSSMTGKGGWVTSRVSSMFVSDSVVLSDGGDQLQRAKAAEARAGRGNKVFVDATAMKEQVKQAVMKPEYNVFDLYLESGIWQKIARSNLFENITLVIVFINAIWIWIDTDFNSSDSLVQAHPVFILAENFFCAYYSFELFTRFMSFKRKRQCFQDAWFNFDAVLVFVMVVETWVMTLVILCVPGFRNRPTTGGPAQLMRLVRLMRLTRMARMVRLLRAIPELMVLCKSVAVAFRSVVFTLCLLVVFVYVFALIFVQLDQSSLLGSAFTENLKNVPDAMMFLLLRGILPDLAEPAYTFGSASALGSVIFLAFILVASLTIMNMLMGVLVQVIGVLSDVEHERMTVQWVKVKLLEMMESTGLDDDGNMQISKREFQRLLLNPKAAKMVQEVGVDVVGLVDFADFIFENDRELTFADFMDIILQLRGTNKATVKDIVDLRKFISDRLQGAVAKHMGQALGALSNQLHHESQQAFARHYMQTKSFHVERQPAVNSVEHEV